MSKLQLSVSINLTLGEGMSGHEQECQEAIERWLEEQLVHTVPMDLAQINGLPLVGIDVDEITVEPSA